MSPISPIKEPYLSPLGNCFHFAVLRRNRGEYKSSSMRIIDPTNSWRSSSAAAAAASCCSSSSSSGEPVGLLLETTVFKKAKLLECVKETKRLIYELESGSTSALKAFQKVRMSTPGFHVNIFAALLLPIPPPLSPPSSSSSSSSATLWLDLHGPPVFHN